MMLPALLLAAALQIGGKPVFPIGFTTAPPPEGDGYRTLAQNGTVFNRCGTGGKWGPDHEALLDKMLAHAAASGMLCAIWIPDLAVIKPGDAGREAELRRVVMKYRNHPALAFWKGADEPEWGKIPPANLRKFYEIVHELDPRHPVWITQAPRGALESLKNYAPVYDIGAMDVYPVSYPPGVHADIPNKNLSMVGDYAQRIAAAGGAKPFWMVLQICFSGVTKPGRTLRFPTFAEERYMSYQSIIAGARGLLYFGGNVEACMSDADRARGWNWTFYRRVLQPLLEEFHPNGPLFPALIAPESKLSVQVSGAAGVEVLVREVAHAVYVIAAKREGATAQVKFTGLPADVGTGTLLYEEPRKVTASGGSFDDWFGPNEVHVYRFARK